MKYRRKTKVTSWALEPNNYTSILTRSTSPVRSNILTEKAKIGSFPLDSKWSMYAIIAWAGLKGCQENA